MQIYAALSVAEGTLTLWNQTHFSDANERSKRSHQPPSAPIHLLTTGNKLVPECQEILERLQSPERPPGGREEREAKASFGVRIKTSQISLGGSLNARVATLTFTCSK